MECDRIWRGNRSSGYVGNEAGSKEDGENSEVLCIVLNKHFGVARAEGILNMWAEIMREHD